MRQVNEAELVVRLKYRLSRLGAATRKALASHTPETRRTAEQMIAIELARGALGRYEILSSAPLPPNTDLFTAAAYGTAVGGAAPQIDDGNGPT